MTPVPALSPKLQAMGRSLIMQLHMVIKTLRFHDVNNQALLVATEHLRDTINTLWAALNGSVRLQLVDGVAYLNDARLRLDQSLRPQLDHLQEEFASRELGGLAFTRPVDAHALRDFLQILTKGVEASDDVVALKQSLEKFRELALELLDPKKHADAWAESEEVRVDRRTFGLQSYAKAVVAMKESVEALKSGRELGSTPLNVTRIVQDLVDIGTERVNFLLKLGSIKQANEYNYNHAANTCVLSIVLGRALGVHRLQLVDLGLSGLFADLGFALLPPELVDRERELTNDERQEIQTAMLQQVRSIFAGDRVTDSMMRRVVVAYEHHLPYRNPESGQVQDLHPFSRVVAVADAFDALTTRRPWREGFTADEALKILSDEAGSRFDPLVVRLLVNLMGVYPLGAVVALKSGELAIVYHTSNDPELFAKPWVKVVRDAGGQRIKRTVIRNLAQIEGPEGEVMHMVPSSRLEGDDPAMLSVL